MPLFRACDEKYAVANAKEELKNIADGVIESNINDGVAKYLNSIKLIWMYKKAYKKGEKMDRLNLGIFASHGGSNMQAIIDACKNDILNVKIGVVISNNSTSTALERAKNEGIPNFHLSSMKYPQEDQLDKVIFDALENHSVNLIVLAGYMKKLGIRVLSGYRGMILNIHPSLLPKYGGKGMYGHFVHEAVLKAGEKKTGVTIHVVDDEYDTGKIVNQCEVEVKVDDTVEILSKRVLEKEHQFYVETLRLISDGKISL